MQQDLYSKKTSCSDEGGSRDLDRGGRAGNRLVSSLGGQYGAGSSHSVWLILARRCGRVDRVRCDGDGVGKMLALFRNGGAGRGRSGSLPHS
eukprot:SAG31_NODE_4995_length_2814_cov_1.128545_1_plen_92_part_00